MTDQTKTPTTATADSLAREVLDRVDDGFFIVDRNWRFLYLNEHAHDVMHASFNSEDVLGKSIWEVSPQLLGTRYEATYRAAMESGQTAHFEIEAHRDHQWYEVHAYPLPQGLAVSFRNIHDRKTVETEALQARAEAERRAQEEAALRRATEAVSATFSVNDVINQIAHSALDATHADGSFVERMSPDSKSIVVVATAGTMCPELGTSVPFEGSVAQYVLEKKQPHVVESLDQIKTPLPGTLAETHATSTGIAVPLIDAGEAIGALILLRGAGNGVFTWDEAQRAHTFGNLASMAFRKVHLLEASEQRSRELEQVMESRTRLVRGFSHDVKNPLGAADGHAALLEDGMIGELTPQQMNSVARIRAGIASAVALINDLVELARAEAGQLVLKQQPVDVREIVRELVENYRPAAEQAGLSIKGELGAVKIVSTDSDRVRQILGNLVSNAVKYTNAGGGIVVRTRMADEKVAIDVVDTGIGIPADKLDVLFKEFERIDPTVKPGAGLGLAISRRIARLLGGNVTVETRRGSGSTFTLWVPDA